MKTTLLAAILIFCSLTTLNAQVIFQSDFDNLTINSPLNSQNGWTSNSSNGGTGTAVGAASMPSEIVNFPLSYTDYGTAVNSLNSDNTIDSDGPGRLLPAPITSGTFYVGFVINVTNAPPATNVRDVIRVLNGGAFSTTWRVYVQRNGGSGFNVGIKIGDPSTPPAVTTTTYNYNQNHLIVVKYTVNSGTSNDLMSVFVDPNYAAGEPSQADAIAPVSQFEASTNIDRIAFPWNVNNANRFNGHVGLMSITNSWADLTLSTEQLKETERRINYYSSFNQLVFTQPATGILSVYSMDGKLVLNEQLNSRSEVSMTTLDAGVYVAAFINTRGERETLKFVIH